MGRTLSTVDLSLLIAVGFIPPWTVSFTRSPPPLIQDFILRQRGIQNIALGGFLTNCCVESTMRSAYERGYNVITLKDCCAATR